MIRPFVGNPVEVSFALPTGNAVTQKGVLEEVDEPGVIMAVESDLGAYRLFIRRDTIVWLRTLAEGEKNER